MRIEILNKNKAYLNCRFTLGLNNALRRMEGYKCWLKNGNLRFVPTGSNIKLIKQRFPDIEIVREPPAEQRDIGDISQRFYAPKTKPYLFQQMALSEMASAPTPYYALFCEQGTGKSKMAIDWAGYLWVNGKIDSVVIVSPKQVHEQWVLDEIPKHCGGKFIVQYWRNGRTVKPYPRTHATGEYLRFFSINYESVYTKKGKEAVFEFLRETGKFLVIFDESHFVKNVRAKRWKGSKALAEHPKNTSRLLLTGTPIAKDLTDEWAQLKILNEDIIGIRYITAFRNRYCVLDHTHNYSTVIGARNLEEFKSITKPHIFRATEKDLPGLPKKVYRRFSFRMTKTQRVHYDQMRIELLAMIDRGEIVNAVNDAVKVSKLQQISNGFLYRDKDTFNIFPISEKKIFKNPRIAAMKAIVDADETDSSLLVWCRFRHDIKLLKIAFPDSLEYHQGISEKDKRSNINRWLKPDGPRLLLATPGSGGTGLNLQGRCFHAVYYSNSENSIQRWQSEKRIHRIGATAKKVIYTDLIAKASRDINILANLKAKKELSDMTLDDLRREIAGS